MRYHLHAIADHFTKYEPPATKVVKRSLRLKSYRQSLSIFDIWLQSHVSSIITFLSTTHHKQLLCQILTPSEKKMKSATFNSKFILAILNFPCHLHTISNRFAKYEYPINYVRAVGVTNHRTNF